jgi:hypothetical protein
MAKLLRHPRQTRIRSKKLLLLTKPPTQSQCSGKNPSSSVKTGEISIASAECVRGDKAYLCDGNAARLSRSNAGGRLGYTSSRLLILTARLSPLRHPSYVSEMESE